MAKSPPIEFFEVTLRCPKELLGEVVSDFNKRGLTEVSFNLVTAVKAYKHNTVANKPEVSSQDFLAEWTKEHPTFKAKEAVNAFKADGRGLGTSTYHALTALVADGVLKKLDEGMYSRADVKALPAPKKKGKQVQVRRDVDHRMFLLRAASRNHGRFNTSWMKEQFVKDKRVPGNVSPTIAVLVERKLIKRVGQSEYVLLEKSKEKKKQKPKAAANGHAVEVSSPGV